MTTKKNAFFEATAPREERVEVAGVSVLVREMASAAQSEKLKDATEAGYAFLVMCCFDPETGEPLFSDDDVPTLKTRGRKKLDPLFAAVARVNGFDVEGTEKNSGAALVGG